MATQTNAIGDVDPRSVVPNSHRAGLRACLGCRMVKTADQFVHYGCENCPHLDMQNSREQVNECTTTNFEGMIVITDPSRPRASWVAKWNKLDRMSRGVYAVEVHGELPDDMRGGDGDIYD